MWPESDLGKNGDFRCSHWQSTLLVTSLPFCKVFILGIVTKSASGCSQSPHWGLLRISARATAVFTPLLCRWHPAVRLFLTQHGTQLLVQAMVISRIQHNNPLLAGTLIRVGVCVLKPLQMVQNAAARLVLNQQKRTHWWWSCTGCPCWPSCTASQSSVEAVATVPSFRKLMQTQLSQHHLPFSSSLLLIPLFTPSPQLSTVS